MPTLTIEIHRVFSAWWGDIHTRVGTSFGCAAARIDERQNPAGDGGRALIHAAARTRHVPAVHALSRVTPTLRDVATADSGVDIAPPNRLATLCAGKVRVNVASAERGPKVWISPVDIDSSRCGFQR